MPGPQHSAPEPTRTVSIGSELVVDRIGYGAMRLTGDGMWGEFPDREAGVALLRRAVEAGVTYIDTADAYGPHTNEMLIRDALYPYPEGLVIATKGGFIRGGPDYADFGAVGNREYLRQSAHLSARRLGVEQIDLYYLHSPNATDVPFADQVATLAELREEGLIRQIGLSNVSPEQFREASRIVDIAAVTALYNLGDRTGADLLAAVEETGTVFSPWYPTSLAKFSAGASDAGPDPDDVNAVLSPIRDKHGATVPQIALAWLLHRSPLILPIPGTTSPAHLDENLASAAIRLTAEEVDAITHLVPEAVHAA
ncbi:aldo/keto reductase [Streptomyces sp. Ag109_G2-15]|uniref:aldo/keto reductase n=1 Tax=Streptomyces sp. Ag109_G2-15 TaxID=1938850 RepID=UPI000BC9EB54|nr:aldo/keto reductase [Streptomyces sp. Ag109_G2-15]SOE06471.1 Predicted oxidoreductase [Streptomyces sp. Ag109_G2-15]